MFDINFLNKPGLQDDLKKSIKAFDFSKPKPDLVDKVKDFDQNTPRLDTTVSLEKIKKEEKRSSNSLTKITTFFGFIILFLFLLYNDFNDFLTSPKNPKIKQFLSNAIYNESDIILSSIDQNAKQTRVILQSDNNSSLINFYNSYLSDIADKTRFFKLNGMFYLEIKATNIRKKSINDSARLMNIIDANSIGDNIQISKEFGNLFIEGKFEYIKHIINDIFENDYFVNFYFKNKKENPSLVFFNME